jgi:hypothetical protein
MCRDLLFAADSKTLLKTGYHFLNSFITCCYPGALAAAHRLTVELSSESPTVAVDVPTIEKLLMVKDACTVS